MQYVKRIAQSNYRVTSDKVYAIHGRSIIDDRGNRMRPCLEEKNGKRYWEVCDEEGRVGYIDNRYLIDHRHIDIPMCRCTTVSINEEENKMLTVETVTLINGKRENEIDLHTIINMIASEEERISELDKIKSESVAINKLKKQHQSNIDSLLLIIDNRDS